MIKSRFFSNLSTLLTLTENKFNAPYGLSVTPEEVYQYSELSKSLSTFLASSFEFITGTGR